MQEVGLHHPPTMSLTRSKVRLTRCKVQRLRDEVPKAAVEGSKRTHRHQEDQPRLHLSLFVLPLTCSHPLQQLLRPQGRTSPFFCLNTNYFYFRERTPTPLQPRDLSQRSQSPDPPPADVDEKESVQAQLLQVLNQSSNISLNFPPQMQMLQGLSGLSQAQGGVTNPLLYYTYYTQVGSYITYNIGDSITIESSPDGGRDASAAAEAS